jgi:hypothetical protein
VPEPSSTSFTRAVGGESRGGPSILWLVGLVAVLAAVIVPAVVLIARSGGGAGPAAQGTTTPTTTTTTSTVAGGAAQVEFARLAGDASLGGVLDQEMTSIAHLGSRLLGGGFEARSDGLSDAALWTGDANGFTRVESGALGGPGSQIVNAVALSGSTAVAVGSSLLNGDQDAAVWVANGTAQFERVCTDDAVCGDAGGPVRPQRMFGVAATPSGFVAVGQDIADGHFDAAVWSSPDGVTWSRVSLPSEGFAGPGDQIMRAVVSTGSGLVAAGRDRLHAAVWRSPDGVRWSRVRSSVLDGASGAAEMKAIAVGGPGLVVAGWADAGGAQRRDAAVWTFDGTGWKRVRSAAFDLVGRQEARGVGAAPAGILVVGYDFANGSNDGAVWRSSDGVTWQRVTSPVFGGEGDQEIDAVVAADGGRGILVGDASSPRLTDRDAAVWTASKRAG